MLWLKSRFLLSFFLFASIVTTCSTPLFAIDPSPTAKACGEILEGKDLGQTRLPQNHAWTPNLKTLEGRVELLMSVLERHPNFVTASLNFGSVFFDLRVWVRDQITLNLFS